MVNGGAGLRFDVLTVTPRTAGRLARSASTWRRAVSRVRDHRLVAGDAHELRRERRAVRRQERHLDRPELDGDKRPDLALPLHHQANRDRLDASGGEAGADLPRDERAQRVADQAVHDPARLLRVHEVAVDRPGRGERRPDGRLGDLAEGHAARSIGGQVRGLRHVPGDRLPFPVEVRGQEDVVRSAARLLDRGDLAAPVGRDLVVRREVVLHVDAELALAGVLRQVADVAVGGEHRVAGPKVAFDRLRLRGRLDDHEICGHGERV